MKINFDKQFEDLLDGADYELGALETVENSVKIHARYLEKLTKVLIEKGILNCEQVETMIRETNYRSVKITIEELDADVE